MIQLHADSTVHAGAITQAEEDIADLRGQVAYLQEVGSGLNLGLNGLGAQFPGLTVTTASLANLATATVPANDAHANAIYELDVWGTGTQGSTLQTLEFSASFGGTAMLNITMGTLNWDAVSKAFNWRARTRVICLTAGASGTWQNSIQVSLTENSSSSGIAPGNDNTGSGFNCNGAGTYTVDTTSSQTLAVQAAWGSATGSPTLTSQVSLFRRIA